MKYVLRKLTGVYGKLHINTCIMHFPCKLYIRSLKEWFPLLYRYVSHLTKMFIACDSSSGETADSIY